MDDDDFLYHVVTPSVHHSALGFLSLAKPGEGIHQDFILLASKRRPCGSGWVLENYRWWHSASSLDYNQLFLFHSHQRSICDCAALCVPDLSPPHWRLQQRGGSLCWFYHTGHQKQHVTGKPNSCFHTQAMNDSLRNSVLVKYCGDSHFHFTKRDHFFEADVGWNWISELRVWTEQVRITTQHTF